MKYFTTKKIGKYEIVSAFCRAPIDPELTKQAIEQPLKESKEWENLFNLGQKKFGLMRKLSKAKSPEYEAIQQDLASVEQQILNADNEFLKKRRKLYEEHAVYSQPADGIMVNNDEKKELINKFINANVKGNYVTLDGNIVTRQEVMQSEIDCLTKEQKNNRKQHELTKALSASVQMKNELEVTGDPDAVKKSMDYYNEQKEKIDRKYGG